jgi:hypothetical protein
MASDKSDEEDRERVLAPDDLDITKRPEVEEIDNGRYVVSPNGPAKKPNKDLLDNPDWLNDPDKEETDPKPSQQESETEPPARNQSTGQPPADKQPKPQQSTPDTQSTSSDDQPEPTPGPAKGTSESQPTTRTDSSQSTTRTQSTTEDQSPTSSQSAPASQSTPSSQTPPNTDLAAHDQPPVDPPAVEFTNENVSRFLAASLAESSGDYGFDATINIEGQVKRGQMTSDDIGETLETLLRWYARQTTDEVEPEAVLGIILAGSDLAVEYPVQSAYAMLKRHDLKPDDSIGDLLAAVRQEGSFTVPPSKDR